MLGSKPNDDIMLNAMDWAVPGSKMASAGADWQTNPATQIKWGLGYIQSIYGTPCGAWSFWQGHGWY